MAFDYSKLPPGDQATYKKALTTWHSAKEAAQRYNRNLLQYAAAIGAVFGIGTGASGIFVVAEAQTEGQLIACWGQAALYSLAGFGFLILVFLAWQLVCTFRSRRTSEQSLLDSQARLININPTCDFMRNE